MMSLDEVAQSFAEELILFPQYTGMDVEAFAESRGLHIGDEDMAKIIVKTHEGLRAAYNAWKETR